MQNDLNTNKKGEKICEIAILLCFFFCLLSVLHKTTSISAYPIQTHFFAKKWVSFFDPNMDSIIGSKNEGLFLRPHFFDPNMDLILQITAEI